MNGTWLHVGSLLLLCQIGRQILRREIKARRRIVMMMTLDDEKLGSFGWDGRVSGG